MFAPDLPKPTIWERIKMFFGWRKKYVVPEFKTFTMPIIESDFPNLNKNVFVDTQLLKSKRNDSPSKVFVVERSTLPTPEEEVEILKRYKKIHGENNNE